MASFQAIANAIREGKIDQIQEPKVKVYPRSYHEHENTKLLMIRLDKTKYIVAVGSGALYDELQGEEKEGCKLCGLTHENRLVINRYFDFTVPRAFGTKVATIGLGDRLGLASPGHIKTVEGRDVRPILAQQSIRELDLTGRNYKEVLDAACFAVFQEGYKDGFGADGDHLKVESDIQMSLDLGFTMLTLDCSEKINNDIEGLSADEIADRYAKLDETIRKHYEEKFLDRTFDVEGTTISFDRASLMKNVLIYGEAIEFMVYIYEKYIKPLDREIDFEISIDETMTPTAPEAHYFVAKELYDRGLEIYSMAPRFCGEFQKGIDYIGDIEQFERELAVHARIADHFGYKLSIHSGSDKFSVFELIGRYTKGRFHVKTAGTNWLEAVRVVARVNPDLYRRMHRYALEHVHKALKYYHITADFDVIKPLDEVSDAELPDYMNDNNARQLIHITYGLLLQAKDESGKSLFKDEFYDTLIEQEEAYEQALQEHIGKHLRLLGK